VTAAEEARGVVLEIACFDPPNAHAAIRRRSSGPLRIAWVAR
jgi:hypothetical protein